MSITRVIFLFWLAVTQVLYAQTSTFPELPNVHHYSENLVTSGQPSRGQLSELNHAGFKWVVNLSPKSVPGAIREEQQLIETAGMGYIAIPVDWDKPSADSMKKFFEFMDLHREQKILVHCWVNARSSAFVYAYRSIRENEPEDVEYKILVQLWDRNQGYELRNVPHWQKYLATVKKALLK